MADGRLLPGEIARQFLITPRTAVYLDGNLAGQKSEWVEPIATNYRDLQSMKLQRPGLAALRR
jgi:hypothetical protein